MVSKEVVLWFRRLNDRLTGFLIAFAVTVFGYMVVLSFCRMLWRLYSETKVGNLFAAGNQDFFSSIDEVIIRNPFMLSFEVSFLALKVCLAAALLAHFSLLRRFCYDSQEIGGKIIYTGLPCAVLTACCFEPTVPVLSFAVVMMPSLALFAGCFGILGKFFPDSEDLIKIVREKMRD